MTNKEKAREIAESCSVMPLTPITQADVLAMTNNAAMQALELKDKEWAERFKKAFEGLWTASFNVDNLSSKTETTIEFKLVTRE